MFMKRPTAPATLSADDLDNPQARNSHARSELPADDADDPQASTSDDSRDYVLFFGVIKKHCNFSSYFRIS